MLARRVIIRVSNEPHTEAVVRGPPIDGLVIDARNDNTDELHRIVQPVELAAGWAAPELTPALAPAAASAAVPLAFAASTPAAGRTATASRATLHHARALVGSAGRVADRDADLAELRDLAATEARRLEHRPTSEREMRDVLDDLATRLGAILRHFRMLSGDTTRLAAILKLLRDRSCAATERWDRAKHALRELAAAPSSSSLTHRTWPSLRRGAAPHSRVPGL